MSVKIFIHDARQFVEQVVVELCEKLNKINLMIREPNNRFYEITEEGQQVVEGRDEIVELVRTMRGWLEMPDLWEKDNGVATVFKMPASTARFIFNKDITGINILCHNAFFEVKGICSQDEAKLLVLEKVRKLRSQVDYLKFRQESSDDNLEYERLPIPEEVRNEVWRRDQAKCTRCNSVFKLEFDHIIPVSRGGSNTARNIQLLCEICNRQKSDSIG
jgi:hypothetical protein